MGQEILCEIESAPKLSTPTSSGPSGPIESYGQSHVVESDFSSED